MARICGRGARVQRSVRRVTRQRFWRPVLGSMRGMGGPGGAGGRGRGGVPAFGEAGGEAAVLGAGSWVDEEDGGSGADVGNGANDGVGDGHAAGAATLGDLAGFGEGLGVGEGGELGG